MFNEMGQSGLVRLFVASASIDGIATIGYGCG
jgi:hypothetical protein